MNAPIVFALIACLFLAAGCCPARRREPFTDRQLTEEQPQGRRLFQALRRVPPLRCHGVRSAINNRPRPRWLIRLQVRRGLGVLPVFSKEKLSDTDLKRIIAFLKSLRASNP